MSNVTVTRSQKQLMRVTVDNRPVDLVDPETILELQSLVDPPGDDTRGVGQEFAPACDMRFASPHLTPSEINASAQGRHHRHAPLYLRADGDVPIDRHQPSEEET